MTTETLQWLLAQLGADTDQADLTARYTRLRTARAVAIEMLRLRLAALLATPLKVTLTNVVAVDNSANAAALQAQILALEAGEPPAPDDPVATTGEGFSLMFTVPLRRTR